MKQGSAVARSERVARHIEDLAEHGYTVIEPLVSEREAQVLLSELKRVETERGSSTGRYGIDNPDDETASPFLGSDTVRTSNLVKEGPVFEALGLNPIALELVDHLLGADPLLSNFIGLDVGPGAPAQPFHCDDTSFGNLPRPHVPLTCNLIVALTDFTEANAATRVVPGSHKSVHAPGVAGRLTDGDGDYDWVAATMPAGSAVLYHGSLIHSAGANTSSEWRPAIGMQFVAGWVRPAYNFALSIPIEQAKGFPRRLQELCGFGLYQDGYIGRLEGEKSAIDLLLNT